MADEALDLNGAAEALHKLRQPAEEQPKEEKPTEDIIETPDEGVSDETPETPEQAREEAEPDADDAITLDADQVASILGIESDRILIDDEGKVKFRTKVDGEDGNATLNDALERYQRDANLTNRSKELGELKKQAENQLQMLNQQIQQSAQQQEAIFSTLETELLSPYNDINWRTLKEEDPTDYAIKRSEMSEIKEKLKTQREQAGRQLAEQWQYAQAQNEGQLKAYVAEQKQLLKEYIPDWNDQLDNDIRGFLRSEGISDQEINQLANAKWLKIINQARLYTNGKESVSKKLKKTLPKVLRPGSKPSKQTVQGEQIKKAAENFKKSGSIENAAALFRARYSKE